MQSPPTDIRVKTRAGKKGKPKGRNADPKAWSEIRELLGGRPRRRDLLIEFLHLVQDRYGHLSAAHLVALAREMKLAPAEVYEVAGFYHHFDVVKEQDTPPPALTVRVCESISCEMFGAAGLLASLEKECPRDRVRIQRVPCVGRCDSAPVVVVGKNPIGRADVQTVLRAIAGNRTSAPETRHVGYDEYRADGGYALLARLLDGETDASHIIEALEQAGLRGLGGAGFPAGRKWRILREQPAPRYLAVNIDEGEPGTFKDRYYLERDPHRLLEGALIATAAVGIESIYFYVRDEYAGIYAMLQTELAKLEADPPMKLPHIELRRGAGAYVCGEESAMIESIEGKRGMPRLRPPFVAQVGLFGRPTLEHNMETLYWVRDIVEKGAGRFASGGRNGRSGMRSFSVSGRVNKPGVHLAPAGITARELIDEYCGGMPHGHEFYGYLPGGASGGILPAAMADIPLDFDTLDEHGCFIGSAAVIILSDQDRARGVALNAMKFFSHESCGKCTPCRTGTAKAVALMKQRRWDLALMNDLSQTMRDASICGLGQAAANPLQCVIRYFPDELETDRSTESGQR